MSRGLGKAQRLMLFRLADHEVRLAEAAAERQRPYRSPDRWSVRTLTFSTFYDQLIARQRRGHDGWQATLRAMEAGEKWALEEVALLVNIAGRLRRPGPLHPTEFTPERPADYELQRFNPGRAIGGLERRGFVRRHHYRRFDNLALTAEGFAEARRLGGVRESEIVDLDRVQANWRDPEDFRLGFSPYAFPRDDDPPREGEFGLHTVVSRFPPR